jgi:eukaryotic-like serine/threonine-protein kinase
MDGSNSDVWVLDLVRNGASRLTFDPRSDRSPVWSPDGSRISFLGGGALYEKPAGGTGGEHLVNAASGGPLDWSRDGRYLLYQDKDDLSALADGQSVPVLKTASRERHGQFAPGGNWIAYASDESKRTDVYVQSFPGSAGKWMISPAGGSQPRWRRDGNELFFVALDGKVMAVPVKADSSFEYGAPTALFELPELPIGLFASGFRYAVTGDGQRFLVLSSAEPASARPVTVLTNWLATVKK